MLTSLLIAGCISGFIQFVAFFVLTRIPKPRSVVSPAVRKIIRKERQGQRN